MKDYLILQAQRRAALFTAHQKLLDEHWDADGRFILKKNPGAHGGYWAILWHCLSCLAGDPKCVERANRIITTNYAVVFCGSFGTTRLTRRMSVRWEISSE